MTFSEKTAQQEKIRQHCIDGLEKQIQDLLRELDNYTVKASSIIGLVGVIVVLLFSQDAAIDKEFIIISLIFLLISSWFCVYMFLPKSINAHLNYGNGPEFDVLTNYLKDRYVALRNNYYSVLALNEKREDMIKYAVIFLMMSLFILSVWFIFTNNNNNGTQCGWHSTYY